MIIVKGEIIAKDLADLGISAETLSAATKIKLELLRAHIDGSRVLSGPAQREILLAIHSLGVLQQLNPTIDFSDPSFVAALLRKLYSGELCGGYSRLLREWEETRSGIREAGEARDE